MIEHVHKDSLNACLKSKRVAKKEVEIGANGTQKYVVKKGPNKGKVL